MNSDIKKILRILYLAIIVLIVGMVALDFYPLLKKVVHLSKKARMARIAVKTLSQSEIDKQINDLNTEISRVKEGLGYVRSAALEIQEKIEDEKNIAIVTLEIEDLATNAEIELSTIKPISMTKKGDYDIQLIELDFRTNYESLTDFLAEIEDSTAFMAVEDMSINTNPSLAPNLNVRLTLYVLFHSRKTIDEII